MEEKYNIVIIGGGVIGCAIAYTLIRSRVKNIAVLERNDTIPGVNQSSRNGGVIHSGIYYPKDIEPLKARLCTEGNENMYQFCKQFDIPCKQTGKLILATTPQEEEYLKFFYKIGEENGIGGLQMLTGADAKVMEPNLGDVTMAIHVPNCGSVALDPYVAKLYQVASDYGVEFFTNHKVTGIAPESDSFALTVQTIDGERKLTAKTIINAAGLYADEIARMVNPESSYEIEGTRGELAAYDFGLRPDVSVSGMHLYPAPFCYYNDTKDVANVPPSELMQLLKEGKVTKTLGAHVSPVWDKEGETWSLSKTISVGPLKNIGYGKEDYDTNAHPMSAYINKVKSYFPNLKEEDLRPRFSGIMAVLKGKTDFVIERDQKYPNCINLVGMDSPAWTASLAIAQYTYQLYKK